MNWFEHIAESAALNDLVALVEAGGAASARGSIGSSTTIVAAALHRRTARPVLLVTAHLDEADEAVDELEALDVAVHRFPAMELLPGESSVALDLLAERLSLARRLAAAAPSAVIAAPIHALMQCLPAPADLHRQLRVVQVGDRLAIDELAGWLAGAGYVRVDAIETPGDFAVRGGIIDIFAPGGVPSRLDLFGDEVEGLFEIDLDTMGSDRRLTCVEIAGAADGAWSAGSVTLAGYLPAECVTVLHELIEISEQGRGYDERVAAGSGVVPPHAVLQALRDGCAAVIDINQFSAGAAPDGAVDLPVAVLPPFAESVPEAMRELADPAAGGRTFALCQNDGENRRMSELLAEHGGGDRIAVETRYLHRGFIWEAPGEAPVRIVPYHELLHRYQTRRSVRRIAGHRAADAFLDLEPGSYVVHRDHGIAKFVGLTTLKAGDKHADEEFLTLEFARRARLHVPAGDIRLVQRYIGAFTGAPSLSTLGGRSWERQKEKVAEAVKDLAARMLQIQAAREASPGIRFPADTGWQSEFEAEFPYQETDDQLACIAAVKKDMSDPRPMDRLICGDVGFGKTEIAVRAAFKAAEFGKQVAVLVPTTLLAEQHERTFRERFADYPFRVEALSRFKTRSEQRELLADLARGRIDVVIGTHRLISRDVRFADLGLVVIDEEQRFGVEHKQRLLELRTTADVLTLSATPIPRTLHMSLLGLRDISSLSTPPLDRRAVVTDVIPHDTRRIKQAIERELAREGQIFFVHNRVHNIRSVADEVQKLVPDARLIIGHGQMADRELEQVMLRFLRRDADILVCTTIIESGIDIPTANTMFINDADMFGLSELHQLRGRVGRYKHRAYCYLLLPRSRVVSKVALKRLRAIEDFSMLGAGFKIALRDLEIRGAGNLLGAEQSGHIAVVGYEMYCELLERTVRELKQLPAKPLHWAVVDLGIKGSLPRGYIPSNARRMDAYRRLSVAEDFKALERVEHDLVTAYGALPAGAETLMRLTEIRIAATTLGVASITQRDRDIILRTRRPRAIEERLAGVRGSVRVVGVPDADGFTDVYYRPPTAYLEPRTLLTVLRRRLGEIAETPAAGPAVGIDAGG